MKMLELLILLFWFGLTPCLLHELGHWIVLKYYHIPYRFFFSRSLLFGFKTNDTNGKSLKAGLAGAFTPLIILIPCILTGDFFIIWFGSIVCLIYALWTCWEVWINITTLMNVKGEKHG